LARHIVERPGRRDGGRSLLWLARLRHRRLDPLAIRRQWPHRLKPTWGRVSRYGVFELAATLDHVGPMARSAADAGAILGIIAGSDPNDPTAALDPVPDYLAFVGQGVRGLRIGVDPAWNGDERGCDDTGRVVGNNRGLPHARHRYRQCPVSRRDAGRGRLGSQCAVEAAVAHEATYPSRKDEYGPVLASVIEAGRALSGLDYQKILLRRLELRGRVAALFGTIDLLLTPVHSVRAADPRHDPDAWRTA